MKTKPFDLEAALNGAKLVTRSGIEVVDFQFFEDPEGLSYPCMGFVQIANMRSRKQSFTRQGRANGRREDKDDLFLVDESEYEQVESPTAEQPNPLEEKVQSLGLRVLQLENQLREVWKLLECFRRDVGLKCAPNKTQTTGVESTPTIT